MKNRVQQETLIILFITQTHTETWHFSSSTGTNVRKRIEILKGRKRLKKLLLFGRTTELPVSTEIEVKLDFSVTEIV